MPLFHHHRALLVWNSLEDCSQQDAGASTQATFPSRLLNCAGKHGPCILCEPRCSLMAAHNTAMKVYWSLLLPGRTQW